jgi:hypothetical protein
MGMPMAPSSFHHQSQQASCCPTVVSHECRSDCLASSQALASQRTWICAPGSDSTPTNVVEPSIDKSRVASSGLHLSEHRVQAGTASEIVGSGRLPRKTWPSWFLLNRPGKTCLHYKPPKQPWKRAQKHLQQLAAAEHRVCPATNFS